MNIIENFLFLDEEEHATTSNIFACLHYTDGTIEVKGNAAGFSISVEGCLDQNNPEWTELAVVDENSYEILSEITENGLYSFNAMGKMIRVKLNSISSGKVTVFGKFLG